MKNATPFHTHVYNHVIEAFKLKRTETRVLFRLIGLLLLKNDPIVYSTQSLANKEQYSTRTVLRALKCLEKLLLITRVGRGYSRRFIKGQKLIEICSELNSHLNCNLHHDKTTLACETNSMSNKNNTATPICHTPMPKCHSLELKEENKNTTTVVAVTNNKNINSPQAHSKGFQFESRLRAAYRNKPYVDDHIKTEDDFIEYCQWSIEHDRPKDIKKAGRVKMLIKFIEQDELEVSEKWIRKKQQIRSTHHLAYQEYAGGIIQQIKYGILPKTTKILTVDEWLENQAIKTD